MRRIGLVSTALVLAIASGVAVAAGGGGGGFSAPSAPAPIDVGAEWRSGIDALNAKDWKKGVRHFRKVVEAQPKNPDALNYLGFSYRKTGDSKRALKYYQKALQNNPNHIGANEYLGELYLEMKDVANAEARLSVLNGCCAQAEETARLATAIAEVKAQGTFTPKFPRLSY